MNHVDYASFHSHSQMSLLDGLATIPEYCQRAQELGLRGMGLTDHGSVSGVFEFINACRNVGIVPVPGCEFYVAPINPEGSFVKGPVFYGPGGSKSGKHDVSGNGAYLHLTILAYNEWGLKNLFSLSRSSYDPGRKYVKPRIDFDLIESHNEGLVVLTGCPSSEISTRFLLGQNKEAYDYASRLKDVFGSERMFVEIMDHNMSHDLEKKLLPLQIKMAKDLNLKLIATNDSHYAYKKDAKHHEEMLCLQSGAQMKDKRSDDGGRRFAFDGTEYYLKSGEEMLSIFPEDDYPGAISNTELIMEMASNITVPFDSHLRPVPKIPEAFSSDVEYFKHLIKKGFSERYGESPQNIKKEAVQRINYEFEVIHSSDFIGYFLTVRDYLKYANDNFSTFDENGNMLAAATGVGRGSVGGSIIAYLLNISELDPIKHDLIFERFLSAGRGHTYEIEYSDGTKEEVNVSEKRTVNGEEKYIHELSEGDIVED